MKIILYLPGRIISFITAVSFFVCSSAIRAQQPVISILTNNITASQVTHTGVRGACLRNSSGGLVSSWDSAASFTVNYNAPSPANILRLTQFTVSSFTSSAITMPVDAVVRLRRSANPEIGDARIYYNFWAKYSSIPAVGAVSGTFNFTAPEVVNPEDAFLLNNLSSGYDNIFQNTLANPHFANIERVDFIVPAGLKCLTDIDRLQSGVAVIDRGTGDPFKIAAIKTLDASGNPATFGNLVSVTAANFGGDLLTAAFNYCILINDVKYYSQSRPSISQTQNLRGVYISLADMGLAIGQRFYGYALFGPDVTVANADWTTYPNNTNGNSQLDPVNIMGFYKTPGSLLPLPIRFNASLINHTASLDFTLYNEFNGDHLVIEHSQDGVHFSDLENFYIQASGTYTYTDRVPYTGNNFYRLKMIDKSGISSISETHLLTFESKTEITIFPNPASNQLNIFFPSSWIQEPVSAEIFTSTGQLIKTIRFERAGFSQSIIINTLLPGIYLLRLAKNKEITGYRQTFVVN